MVNSEIDTAILRALFASPRGQAFPSALSRETGATPDQVIERAEVLRAVGYPIENAGPVGLCFSEPLPDVWCQEELAARLRPASDAAIFWRGMLFQKTGSTNDMCRREAEAGAAEGLLVGADAQTAGRGRAGRNWWSEAGDGLWCSVLLRPNWPAAELTRLTILISVALAEAIEDLTRGCDSPPRVEIKWPNDLFVGGRKLGGILNEARIEGGRIVYTVLGFGINMRQRESDFPKDLRSAPCSLRVITGRAWRRADLLLKIVSRLEHWYRADFAETHRAWTSRSCTLGKQVSVSNPTGGTIEGRAIALEEDGALVLETEFGQQRVTAGDVDPPSSA